MSPEPACFANIRAAWNERDPAKLRALVESAVTPGVTFTDPQHAISGREAFYELIRAFHARVGDAMLKQTSVIDMHHDRARYAWQVVWPDGKTFDGLDCVALDLDEMKISRIDGFFGPLLPRE